MPIIVVEVMPKAEILDPQGKAVAGALARLGKSGFGSVRIGKRFELAVDGPVDDALLAEARAIAEELLANLVIEDVVSVHERAASPAVSPAVAPSTSAVSPAIAPSTSAVSPAIGPTTSAVSPAVGPTT